MTSERPLAADTDLAAERQQIAIWRAMTPADKFALLEDLVATARLCQEAGIRARHPNADAAEVRMRRLVTTLGPDLVERVYGWRAPEQR